HASSPSCNGVLAGDDAWERWRVCSGCGRHFAIPARERLRLLLDPGTFVETDAVLRSLEPLRWADRQPGEEESPIDPVSEAVVTGAGRIGGAEAVVIALDNAYLGERLGPVAASKIARAIDRGAADGMPVIALCAAGGAPLGVAALGGWQTPKIAAAAGRLRQAGGALIGIMVHPASGAVWEALLAQSDLIAAEPDAALDLAPGVPGAAPRTVSARQLKEAGLIDALVERPRLGEWLSALLLTLAARAQQRQPAAILRSILQDRDRATPEPDPASLAGFEQVLFARHAGRPEASSLLHGMVSDWTECAGDRGGGGTGAVVAGFGLLAGTPVAAIATRAGARPDAATWKIVTRVLRMAGRWGMPVVVLIHAPADDDGADPLAEAAALSAAAEMLAVAARMPAPVVAVVTGEAGGAGTIALAAADRVLMLEHAVLTSAGRERHVMPGRPGPGAMNPSGLVGQSALSARECVRLGLVDQVAPEPSPAAHADPAAAAAMLADAISGVLAGLAAMPPRRLRSERAKRYRALG
ncbi:MAG: carboxyl transferase domain-containing protein, partial [Thermomicrobiales bacterium]